MIPVHISGMAKPRWNWTMASLFDLPVSGLTFDVRKGEIFGFLGSNGCGKTTTMKILTGLLQQTSGTARLFGQPTNAADIETRMRPRMHTHAEEPWTRHEAARVCHAREQLRLVVGLGGRTVELDGWVLSRTEARLCALATLVQAAWSAMLAFSGAVALKWGIVFARTSKEKGRAGIQYASRYASWVSVVCKHTFLNVFRSRQIFVSLDEEEQPPLASEVPEILHDPALVLDAVRRAIQRLPPYLQEVARLHFIEARSYPDIERLTGRDLPTIRSYVYKAAEKLRKDQSLLTFLADNREDLEP